MVKFLVRIRTSTIPYHSHSLRHPKMRGMEFLFCMQATDYYRSWQTYGITYHLNFASSAKGWLLSL